MIGRFTTLTVGAPLAYLLGGSRKRKLNGWSLNLGGRRNYPAGGLLQQWCRCGDFSGATHSSGDLRIGLGGSAGRRGRTRAHNCVTTVQQYSTMARGASILGGLWAWVGYAGRTQRATISMDPWFQAHSTRWWRMGLLMEGVRLDVGFGTDGLTWSWAWRWFGAYSWDGPGGPARVWLWHEPVHWCKGVHVMVGVSARWDRWRQRVARMVRGGSRMCGGSRMVDLERTMDRERAVVDFGLAGFGSADLDLDLDSLGWRGFAHHARGAHIPVPYVLYPSSPLVTSTLFLGLWFGRRRLTDWIS
ncbi:hypothetical protein GGX14DRAFT_406173 [Mycena pura]|uniref:Uncharacterized protein n=1 Tax=Mycena pura TaxID=153505 RepID=A0AAD6UQJ3_9AGAR|nr:hypothetical protein GGX14DRAFT_406173 [Mycena pura]